MSLARDLADFADPTRVRRVAIALVVIALIVGFVRETASGPDGYVVLAEFNRAGLNIRAGDEVRVRGVPVGTVQAIEVDREDLSARYRLHLQPDVRVAADSGARIVPKTLLGDKYVELDAARSGEPTLAAGALIPRDRTTAVAELETVLDEIGVLVESVDAAALGASIAALGEGLGSGEELGRAFEGFAAMSEVTLANEEAIQRVLAAVPPVASTVEANAAELGQGAEDLSRAVEVLDEREAELGAALAETGELLRLTEELVADERFQRTVDDVLTVLAIVNEHPGAVQEYLQGFPVYLEGFNDAVYFDTLYANVAHLFIALPHVDARGDMGDDQGGRGAGPHIDIDWDDPSDELDPRRSGGEQP